MLQTQPPPVETCEHVHCFDQLGEPNTPGWLKCRCGLTYTEHEIEEAEKDATRQIW